MNAAQRYWVVVERFDGNGNQLRDMKASFTDPVRARNSYDDMKQMFYHNKRAYVIMYKEEDNNE